MKLSKILSNVFNGLLSITMSMYGLSVMGFAVYFNWQYAKEHGFLEWIFFGEIIATLKAFVWPVFISTQIFTGSNVAVPDVSDRVPTTCVGVDKEVARVCEIAKRFKSPLSATVTVSVFAGLERTASVCGFSLNERFYDIRARILTSSELNNAYIFISQNIDATTIPDKNAWCSYHYYTFGPNAPLGPNGVDNRLYR